ncbi:MAG: UDP-2,3-diacylglucosamine diphosphatase [Sulfurovaceae bacterium]|nr:UDP-2,3-diacylglucosamine diphosphatase [Sulfurovaceae bacterium]
MKEIKENAIFIADAHYPHYGDELLEILKKIKSNNIKTPQIFLMGDIFDLLFGYNEYIKSFSQEVIELLNEISKTIEIHYIEGNHDFCLEEVFLNINIYSRQIQPIKFKLNNQIVYLSHGDLYETGFGYNLFSKLLRTKTLLTILRPLDKQVINYKISRLKNKKIYHKFKNFEKRAKDISSHYPKEVLIIEGHYHQGKIVNNYISLPSLASQKQIGVISNQKLIFEDYNIIIASSHD